MYLIRCTVATIKVDDPSIIGQKRKMGSALSRTRNSSILPTANVQVQSPNIVKSSVSKFPSISSVTKTHPSEMDHDAAFINRVRSLQLPLNYYNETYCEDMKQEKFNRNLETNDANNFKVEQSHVLFASPTYESLPQHIQTSLTKEAFLLLRHHYRLA